MCSSVRSSGIFGTYSVFLSLPRNQLVGRDMGYQHLSDFLSLGIKPREVIEGISSCPNLGAGRHIYNLPWSASHQAIQDAGKPLLLVS